LLAGGINPRGNNPIIDPDQWQSDFWTGFQRFHHIGQSDESLGLLRQIISLNRYSLLVEPSQIGSKFWQHRVYLRSTDSSGTAHRFVEHLQGCHGTKLLRVQTKG
jgi:hypothetical protein